MSSVVSNYPHITFREDGTPIIEGKNFKIIHLLGSQIANDWTREDLVANYQQLTANEIDSALDYLADHQEAMMGKLQTSLKEFEKLRDDPQYNQIGQRLRAEGHLKDRDSQG